MTGWMDNIVVFKGAPNLENAKKFQNFMMDPENAAALTNFARYTAGVMGTEPISTKEWRRPRAESAGRRAGAAVRTAL